MHTGDLCFFTGASLFIVGVVGYFFTGPNNNGVYLLSSFVFFVVNVSHMVWSDVVFYYFISEMTGANLS